VLAATARPAVTPPIAPAIPEPPMGASPISLTARPSTTLSVQSTPVGASVRLDGALVGITPIARIEVEPGSHALALELAGHAPHLANVAITEGASERVTVTLEVAAVVEAPEPRAPRTSGGGFSRAPPTRDCYRERTECVRSCESSGTSCEMSCFGCGGCNTSYTSEQCSQMCRQCQDGCERNEDFCTDQCESQERICEGR
jgi:PEGA domain